MTELEKLQESAKALEKTITGLIERQKRELEEIAELTEHIRQHNIRMKNYIHLIQNATPL